ncbi:MAG: tRNA (adenosine(37)-N6)-threonylcarbamoyltransferase complex transferase subunit TsaD [Candidatus Moranbacteria bacterium RBG_19FT_COMBO_42_6]|nr:MAG: tRNA (adenosine(37)-N6)-threonylcarbamoyltransferase complex transferase subunit TsaD [Candidatus Moranbacteria bacterium RBG_19FT_COMBO_42_6]
MIILAIETSCDETAVAIIKSDKESFTVLSEMVSSQIKLHADWGGVVPNLAAREHLKNIMPLIEYSLRKADVSPKEIDLIATTSGPGLIPALLIGNNVSKTLAWIWEKPLLGINHIEGHIYSNFVRVVKRQKLKIKSNKIRFPVLCLIVSGGHTQLVLMKDHLQYKIIGQTLDDAAGEAFDKVARILGLGYPGGPAIAKMAMEFPIFKSQFPNKTKIKNSKLKIQLPRPMINSGNFNFSFSGLKTAVLYKVKKIKKLNQEQKIMICHEFQQAVVDVLVSKTITAAKKFKPKTVLIAGGVSANQELRDQLKSALSKNFPVMTYREPDPRYSIDNAVMIASAAHYRWKKMTSRQKEASLNNWKKNAADANLKLI